MSKNKVILIGHLGADPKEQKGEGYSFAYSSLATNKKWTAKDGTKMEKTDWHNLKFSNTEFALKYLKKGMQICVEGSLSYRSFEDKEGRTIQSASVNVQEVTFLDKNKSDE